jgi:hypothetical protein
MFATPPQFVLESGGKKFTFINAKVEIEKVNETLVKVTTQSISGPFLLETTVEYEFDGMGKVNMTLSCPDDTVKIDSFNLEIPLNTEITKLYHVTDSVSGHAPATNSTFTPKDNLVFNTFREVLWFGNQECGFCWFADDMKNWQIKDENGRQSICS